MTPNRVDCFGVYGVAREVHAISAAPLAAEPWAEDAAAEGEGEVERLRLGRGRGAGPLPALHRPRLHRRDDRSFACLAAGAAGCRRPAADQQRRRHHQLRDAADRAAAACLRPRQGPGRRADRPRRRRGREDDDPRRRRARARRRDRPRLRQQRPLRHRRDHGRPGLRGLRGDDQRPARGRELERDQHPAHLAPARPALGGLLALREAAPPGALHAGAADRLAADGRALRRQAGAGDDRRRRRDPGAAPDRPARRAGRGAARACGSSRPTRSPTWSGSASGSRWTGDGSRGRRSRPIATTTSPARST